MNQYQRDLFANLETLVATHDAFYRQEFKLDDKIYWIYNYRLATYTDFTQPAALECRGIMYEVDATGNAIRLASHPFPKFFNLEENPFTMGLDLSKVDVVELKADGSLMSTYIHNGELRFKSKGSLFSEQALDAIRWINQPENQNFLNGLHDFASEGITINLEWCAPHNRIVIGYPQAHLKVLNGRDMQNGSYVSQTWLEQEFGENVINRVNTNGLDVAQFVQSIPDMQDDIEGFVCRIGDLWFKVKTKKYMSLHHAKDSVTNPRRLFEAVIDEGVDDLRSMFAHDAVAIQIIDQMQTMATRAYNDIVNTVTLYHTNNRQLSRKDYAIGAQSLKYNNIGLLGPAMNMYLGVVPDFKSFVKAKYKELGFKDEKVSSDE